MTDHPTLALVPDPATTAGGAGDEAGTDPPAFDPAAASRQLDIAAYKTAVAGLAHVQAHFARAQTTWDDGRRPLAVDQLERLAKTLDKFHTIGRTAIASLPPRGGLL